MSARWFLIGGAITVLLWGGATAVAQRMETSSVDTEELLYYPSGKFLKQAALGYDHAVGDLAWLRLVQYYGEHVRGDGSFAMMYHLADVISELDPHFEEVYLFSAFVLLTEGKRPEEGMKLLAKGRKNNPESWRLYFETAFMYYIAWQDHQKAAEYFTLAAAMPGAPERADRFAAWVTYRAGELETSRALWAQLAERTTNPELRDKAVAKVEELTERIENGEAGS